MDVSTDNAIVALVEANPTLVLIDEKKFEDFYERVKAEASAMPIDLTTDKGRKAIASMAHKIARTKTAIDDAGKKLNEDARAKINAVDEARRKIRDRFDLLKEDVRKPLTEWEEAEEKRVQRVADIRQTLSLMVKDLIADQASSDEIAHHLENIDLVSYSTETYGADAVALKALHDEVRANVVELLEKVKKDESDREELGRLRRESEEREAAEAARREEEERQRLAAEEAERQEKARLEVEERRKAEQERIEREARERAEAEAQARVEAAERAAREAEEAAARKIEEDRQAREREKAEQERIEREARAADAARQADRDHRAKIMGAAKAAIIEIGIDEAKAKEIVLAIAAGNIPHVSIRF